MIDFDAELLRPIYTALGVPANVSTNAGGAYFPAFQAGAFQDSAFAETQSTGGGANIAVTAIDDTAGVELTENSRGMGMAIQTVLPVARLRARDVSAAALRQSDLIGGAITLRPGTIDQKIWHIDSVRIDPNPTGEYAGEILLILSERG